MQAAEAIGRRSCVPVVSPRVGGVGVAAEFPESKPVTREKDDVFDPFRTFPRIDFGDDDPHGAAVFTGERLAFPFVDEQGIGAGERQGQIGRIAVVGGEIDVRGVAFGADEVADRLERDAAPMVVEPTPR